MHVLADPDDPFYTTLQAGAYAKVKPDGKPCDAAFQEGCKGPTLSQNAKIAMGVCLTVTCLFILGLTTYWIILVKRNKAAGK